MPHQCTGCGHTFADGSKEMLSGCPECGGNKFQFRPEGASFPDDPGADADVPSDGDTPDAEASTPPGAAEPSTAEPPDPDGASSSVAETVGRATTRVRDFVSSNPETAETPDPDASWPSEREQTAGTTGADSDAAGSTGEPTGSGGGPGSAGVDPSTSGGTATDTDDDIIDADARRETVDAGEDDAQASARTDVVSPEELDGAGAAPTEADATEPDPLAAGGSTSPLESDGDVVGQPNEEEPDLAELREQLNDQFESIKIVEPGQYELNLMELYDREEYIIALQENGRYVIQVPEQWLGDAPGER